MKVVVEEHEILVNHLWLALKNEDCIIIQGDLRSKYAEVCGLSGVQCYLTSNENTLHTNKDDKDLTSITFEDLPEEFQILDAIVSRYTLTIYIVNNKTLLDSDQHEMVWETERKD